MRLADSLLTCDLILKVRINIALNILYYPSQIIVNLWKEKILNMLVNIRCTEPLNSTVSEEQKREVKPRG